MSQTKMDNAADRLRELIEEFEDVNKVKIRVWACCCGGLDVHDPETGRDATVLESE